MTTLREPATVFPETLSYDEYREARYFPALDGLRAVAILFVFTAHVVYRPFWGLLNGGEGVTLFFVLSGFLISTLALREEDRKGSLDLRSFYIRRLFRIYPLYFAMIGFYCLLIYGAGFAPERRGAWSAQLPYYLLGFPEHHHFTVFAQQGLEGGPPLQALWSVGIEEKFYLVWPVLGFFILRALFTQQRRLRARLAACSVLLVACAIAPSAWADGGYVFPYVYIIVGVIVALLLHDRRWFTRLRALGRPTVLVALALLALTVQIGLLPHARGSDLLHLAFGVCVAGFVASVVIARTDILRLTSRPMVFVGTISYAFYLTHAFALNVVEKTPLGRHSWVFSLMDVAVALPVALVGSWIVHRYLEKPLIRVGHGLAHREKPFHDLG